MDVSSQPLWLLVLSLGITGSLAGSIVAAVASAINDHFRKRFERKKWRAEFYVGPKLEALRRLYAAMVRSHYEINVRAKARMPRNMQEYKEVEQFESEFFRAFTEAKIYLDTDTYEIMRTVLGAVRQMTTSIWLRLPEVFESCGKHQEPDIREPDWKLFSTSFDSAQSKLSDLLHPNELMKWADQ